MIRKTAIRTMAVGAVLASALALPVSTAGAATNSAATPDTMKPAATDCTYYTGMSNNSDGYYKFNAAVHIRAGVGVGCPTGKQYAKGTGFYAWCGVKNPSSNVYWIFGRIKGTETGGWFSQDSLSKQSGSVHNCA